MLITVFDSGEKTGWAQGWHGRLTGCGLVIVEKDKPMRELPAASGGLVFVERPIHRRKGKQVDPNDLITLGIKVGRLVETYLVLGNHVETVLPATWKGGTPKDIQNDRDRQDLAPEELDLFKRSTKLIAPSYLNNVWDAVGIWIWAARKRGLRE